MASSIDNTFSRTTHVDIDIQAEIELVWDLLTAVNKIAEWNSTLASIEGKIGPGQHIKLTMKANSNSSFKLKITEFNPPAKMVWASGLFPFFKGERVYQLTRMGDSATRFEMMETMKGIVFPLASKHIPDMKPSFDQIAEDLKKAAEEKA